LGFGTGTALLRRGGVNNASCIGEQQFAVLERRTKVSDLYLRGLSQWQIARELGIGQATVSRDLEALRVQWRESSSLAIDTILQRELAKIDLIEAEAWIAWERSKENRERTTKERSSGETSAKSKVVVVTEGRLPDNEFLKTVQWCISKRCEILGLDAPRKLEHSGEIGGAAMSEADRQALIANIAAKLGAMADDREHEDDDDGPGDGSGVGPDPEPGAGGAAPDSQRHGDPAGLSVQQILG